MENKLIRQLLPDKGVMLDVGACYGSSHIPFLGWDIYAFEPDPNNAKKIKPHPGVKVIDVAVSDTEGDDIQFYRTPISYGMSSMLPFFESHKPSHTVKVRRFDTLLPELGVTRVDYIKIDVEGYDFMVLKGFPWDAIRPAVVMCEFGNCKSELLGYSHNDIAEYMIGKGYHVIVSEWVEAEFINGRYQHKWLGYLRYPPPPERAMYWGNMIFINDNCLHRRFCEKAGI